MARNWASLTSAAHDIGPAAIFARGWVSFVKPVIRNIAASNACVIQSAVSMMQWSLGDEHMSGHHAFWMIWWPAPNHPNRVMTAHPAPAQAAFRPLATRRRTT
jgi:hypothetical protein